MKKIITVLIFFAICWKAGAQSTTASAAHIVTLGGGATVTSIHDSLATVVKYVDTSAMLEPFINAIASNVAKADSGTTYITPKNQKDTATAIRSTVNTKIAIADSSTAYITPKKLNDSTAAVRATVNTKLSTTTAASTYAPINTKEIFPIGFTSSSFLASATTYLGLASTSNATTQGTRRIYFNKAGTITGITLFTYAATTTGTSESWTIYARLNQTTDYSIAAVGAATAARLWTNLSMSIPISSSSDYIEIKSIAPAFATPPAGVYGGGFIEFTPN